MPHTPTSPQRDTALALKLKERIRREGPLTIKRYMQACLLDPEHGYYRGKRAIGAQGDYVTAPEISQVFGELVGLWCVAVWQQMGSPQRLNLVELGPGRGTLMRDLLRAARVAPRFLRAISVNLVETNAWLRESQQTALADASVPVAWHEHFWGVPEPLEHLPHVATIVLANEFLDALPIRQYEWGGSDWFRRTVALDGDGRFAFSRQSDVRPMEPFLQRPAALARTGDVFEWRIDDWAVAWLLDALARRNLLAGLIIDYGHREQALGNTLQAVRHHAYECPLASPGEADLTAEVDFASFAEGCRREGNLEVDGPLTQAELLGRLGAAERASHLMAANPDRATRIETDVARLMSPVGMGGRFHALGVRSRELAPLPGFEIAAVMPSA
jgi:SAM-dependent MidA family methyltransferase